MSASRVAARVCCARSTALLRPAKEKCGSAEPTKGRGSGTAARIALGRGALHRRSAGIAQAEQFRGLVERLAGGVVDGGGEAAVAADPLDEQQLAMAARDQQQQIGESEARDRSASARARGPRDG